jgi:magnesium transporter
MWGTDLTTTIIGEGLAAVFVAVDHCSVGCVGIHAAPRATRFEALEAIHQGVRKHFGGFDKNVARGLSVRHDYGSQYMINVYDTQNGCLRKRQYSAGLLDLATGIWIDLVDPTKEEEHVVEEAVRVGVPTREEMREIETSSQLYREGDAAIMTVRVVKREVSWVPALTDATFILTPRNLVTVRYVETKPFNLFSVRADKDGHLDSPAAIMIGILETVVDRAADILEEVGEELDRTSQRLFNQTTTPNPSIVSADLQTTIQHIGRNGDLASKVRESLHGLSRAVSFFRATETALASPDLTVRMNTLRRDIRSLLDHNMYLASNTQFLLDSTLGLINIQQNAIIKIFSVAAVIFLPPTLIASIYGMNFEHMPELKWFLGYPTALGLMVLSAVLPYLYSKRRGWL